MCGNFLCSWLWARWNITRFSVVVRRQTQNRCFGLIGYRCSLDVVSFSPDPSCSVCVTSSVFKFRPNFQRLHHFLFWLFSTSRRCFQFSSQAANATQAKVFFQFESVCSWNLNSDRKLQFPLQQISHKRTVLPVKPTLCRPLSVCCVSSEVKFRFHFHLMQTCTQQTLY